MRGLTWNEPASSLPWEVNARERVRGRKKPSLPRGMERPWTTLGCFSTEEEMVRQGQDLQYCRWLRTKPLR